jgi:hypothetical protein
MAQFAAMAQMIQQDKLAEISHVSDLSILHSYLPSAKFASAC